MENARALGIALQETDVCILSHGHYDHAGGFADFLEQNRDTVVYAMSTVMDRYYSLSGGLHEIGVPEKVLKYRDRFYLTDTNMQLAEHTFLIPHTTPECEKVGERAGLLKECKGNMIPDDFSHELSLVFDTEKGLVIFNSCSHIGIENIIYEVRKVFPDKRLYAFLGGLHMKGQKEGQEICTFSEPEIEAIADVLEREGLEYLYTGHCTGKQGFELLSGYLGNKLKKLTTGLRIEL